MLNAVKEKNKSLRSTRIEKKKEMPKYISKFGKGTPTEQKNSDPVEEKNADINQSDFIPPDRGIRETEMMKSDFGTEELGNLKSKFENFEEKWVPQFQEYSSTLKALMSRLQNELEENRKNANQRIQRIFLLQLFVCTIVLLFFIFVLFDRESTKRTARHGSDTSTFIE
jgi:hypothetical protein